MSTVTASRISLPERRAGYDGGTPWCYGFGRVHVILGDTTYHQSVGIPSEIQSPIPSSQILLEAFPNPFNSSTVLSFQLQVAGMVKLDVFDINGRTVGARHAVPLQKGWYPPGMHQITFDGSGLASGIYLARLQAGSYQATEKLVLLK
ncbi:MAG TPA: T9SS type A sorting domain-containing protein [Bacteroidetes bacterium]|nr:T9SS type A sorting domain-containing protein [Bacteroidota bacterium]